MSIFLFPNVISNMFSKKEANEIASYLSSHLHRSPGTYIAIKDLMRAFIHETGEININYSKFESIVRRLKRADLYNHKKFYIVLDHTLSEEEMISAKIALKQ